MDEYQKRLEHRLVLPEPSYTGSKVHQSQSTGKLYTLQVTHHLQVFSPSKAQCKVCIRRQRVR